MTGESEHGGSESEEEDSHYTLRGISNSDWPSLPTSLQPLKCARDEIKAVWLERSGAPGTPPDEEVTDTAPMAEEETASVVLSSEDPVADTGLEPGDVPSTSESEDGPEPCSDPVVKRAIKPVIRLSYDEPGEPTNKPLVILHRGMRICITSMPSYRLKVQGDESMSRELFKKSDTANP